ncbi:5552_t:CDS:2, partial [Ambispora leptoticha]
EFSIIQQRYATKKAAGSTQNGRDSPGKRLGLKKFGGQPGWVQFYIDPKCKKKYIGVVLSPNNKLLKPPTKPRRRRFDLIDVTQYHEEL